MEDNDSFYFISVKVDGYRGRNFELTMNPEGQNTVYIMDGNTGKTTIIELLRWCFGHRASEAKGKFKHMWNDPAHVLDYLKEGLQTCTIKIDFYARGHNYSYERITKGTYIKNEDEGFDDIESIKDILEIDNGGDVYEDDDVFEYLSKTFRLDQCAEYFCFDGEKAREVMRSSGSISNINMLLNTINNRVTNPKLEEYEKKLVSLKNKIYNTSKSKLTDNSLKKSFEKITSKEKEKREEDIALNKIEDDIRALNKAIEDQITNRDNLNKTITEANSVLLTKKVKLESELEHISSEIESKRSSIYFNCLNWINLDRDDNFFDLAIAINKVKTNVKETGKLPEPYRENLIKSCLEGDQPTCQICGRVLDEVSKERVKALEKLVASSPVQIFLENDFSMNGNSFNSNNENKDINDLINQHKNTIQELNCIKLSKEDADLIKQRDTFNETIQNLTNKLGKEEKSRDDKKSQIKKIEKELKELRDNNSQLNEYRDILEKVDNTLKLIKDTQEKTKERALSIISDVISEGVTSILGSNFSSRLTEKKGLQLAEDGFFDSEAGGMSGRLVLSYCFAEAMTLIDPIIIDTPSGNVGSHRKLLAEHLKVNHKQVILLCLPGEIGDFAPDINDNPITITNNRGN